MSVNPGSSGISGSPIISLAFDISNALRIFIAISRSCCLVALCGLVHARRVAVNEVSLVACEADIVAGSSCASLVFIVVSVSVTWTVDNCVSGPTSVRNSNVLGPPAVSNSSSRLLRLAGGALNPAPTYFSGNAFLKRSRRSVERRWDKPRDSSF